MFLNIFKRLLSTVFVLFSFLELYSQPGSSINNPIELGTITGFYNYTSECNTAGLGNNFGGSGEDAFHRFSVTGNTSLIVDLGYVTTNKVYLLNSYGLEIASHTYNIDWDRMEKEIPNGVYYIVVEGPGSNNGSVTIDMFVTVNDSSGYIHPPSELPQYSFNTPVNYIRTWIPTAPINDASSLMQSSLLQSMQATQYFDGLGRPLQNVVKKGSMITTATASVSVDTINAKDLVTPVLYDDFGREPYQFLPFASTTNNGDFKTNPFVQHQQFMNSQYGSQGNDKDFGYSQAVFEASPLNRVMESYFPGNNFAGSANSSKHGIKTHYWINTAIDDVKIWTVTDGPIGDGAGGGSGVQANVTVNSRTAHPPPYVASNSITFADGFESLPGDNFTASIVSGGGSGVPSDLITSNYSVTGAYLASTLYKNVTTDEQGKQVIEFKDKEGKVVLKKVQLTAAPDAGNGSGYANWMCTYYIYDDLGNLRCVIQPEGVKQLAATSWQLTETLLKEQCFRYEYDGRNRMIVKKVPGAGEVAMVYDVRDRLVMTQDGNLRSQGLWNFTQYDGLNRPVRTGLLNPQSNDPNTHWAAAGALSGTTNEAISYPATSMLTGTTALTETFYDNYDWVKKAEYGISDSATFKNFDGLHNSYLLAASNTSFPYAQQPVKDERTKGLVTGTRTNVLGTNTYITAVTIYDNKARPIQVKVINQTNGRDITTTQYSWSGQPLVMISRQHKNDVSPLVITSVTRNTYDALGRVTQTVNNTINNTTSVQSGDKVMSRNYYDALGQLKTKGIGQLASTSAPVETQNYEYNIRGWLLGVNRNYVNSSGTGHSFGYDLAYDKVTNSSTNTALQGYTGAGMFNGNITGMTWRGSTGAKEIRRYNYTYDAANRLIKSDFGQYTGGSNYDKSAGVDYSSYMGNGNYADNNVNAYDLNGNILAMTQRGLYGSSSATIDQLTYVYKPGSNKLAKVTDLQTVDYQLGDFKNGTNTDDDYDYDINGNLTKDQNKGISSISYNILNLPQTITVVNKGTISYLYDAAGNKLGKTVNETGQATKTTQYVGGLIFENGVLQHVATEEGRVRLESGQWHYDYFLKDHLGNVRVMLDDNAAPLEETHYYPFGLFMSGISTQAAGNFTNKKKYQGYEQNTDLDLNLYETFFRSHDPQIGRFLQVDPKPSDYESPYVAMGNNPILNFDLLGDTTYRFDKATGAYIGMFDLDAAGQVGSYGSMKTIGKGKNKQEVWNGTRFEFADPQNDAQQIRDGVINQLVFVSDADMKDMLTAQGAFNYDDKNSFRNFYKKSTGGQDFDYSISVIPAKYGSKGASATPLDPSTPSRVLFLPQGDYTAHNHMNFGNYLWAASGYTLGFNFSTLQLAAHANSLINSKKNGYPAQWDSKDDQNSIKLGAYHSLEYKYRAVLEARHKAELQKQGGPKR